jgi:putative peptidoglycan lipid II flippase
MIVSKVTQKTSLRNSVFVTGFMTFISRVTGLIRDILFSQIFGVSANMDSFLVAFKIPNLLRRFFAEGAFSQGFVPVLNEYKEISPDKLSGLVGSMFGSLSLILFIITAIGTLLAPAMVYLFAPGFSSNEDQLATTAQMLRYAFPYIFFISLTSLLGSLLNAHGNFSIPAITPVILNLCLICASIFLSSYFNPPELALAVAVFFSGLFQLLFQFPFILKKKLTFRPRIDFSHPGVRQIYKLMLPGIFGSSVAQINILFDTLIASFLVSGSISWLYYSDRLMEFPLGVFAVAVATVILPRLSSEKTKANIDDFKNSLAWGMNAVITIGLPSTIGIILVGDTLLYIIFFSPQFSLMDISMAYASLVTYSLGLLAFMLMKILAAGYYSRKDTKTPVRFAVYSLFLNLALNIIFVYAFNLFRGDALHAGLALATSCAAVFNASLLYRGLVKVGVIISGSVINLHNFKKLIASFIMALFIVLSESYYLSDLSLLSRFEASIILMFIIAISACIYFFIWYLFIHHRSDAIKVND